MFSKKLFSVVAMLIGMVASFGAYAQNLTVRGTVKDATGPVVGAVVLSGGANAVTDVNGNYSITVPSNAVLEVSCLGYATQNVNVKGRAGNGAAQNRAQDACTFVPNSDFKTLFVNYDGGDFHPAGVALTAGEASSVVGDILGNYSTDLEGNPRYTAGKINVGCCQAQ